MLVSILICTCNRASHLRETLASVGQLAVPEHLEAELIIVDNGSTDGTSDLVRALTLPNMPVRLALEPVPGVARARNTGLRAARGDILLVTDDDTRLPRNWIRDMCRPILEDRADAVAGTVVLADHLQRPWMEPFHRAILSSTDEIRETDPNDIFGASMGFSRTVFEKVPWFDPELGPGTRVGGLEDTLFAWQLRRAGCRIVLVKDAVVEHAFDESRLRRDAFLRAARKLGRSRAYIAYHWQHEPESALGTGTHPWVNLAKRCVRYGLQRCVRWRECGDREGIAQWEFIAVRNIASIRQYLRERKRPRNYEQHALIRNDVLHANPTTGTVAPEDDASSFASQSVRQR